MIEVSRPAEYRYPDDRSFTYKTGEQIQDMFICSYPVYCSLYPLKQEKQLIQSCPEMKDQSEVDKSLHMHFALVSPRI